MSKQEKHNKNEECVKVVVRCRPLNPKEKEDGRTQVVFVNPQRGEISVTNPKGDQAEAPKVFTFDSTFEPEVEQETVYKNTAYPIVESVLEGYNGTIFAYGQTGTGKTHTMEGKDEPKHLRGIIPRTFDHIFRSIKGTPNVQFLVRVSFLELYNEEIRDLLQKNIKKLELREKPGSGVYVKDLSTFMIQDQEELREKLLHGRENRAVGATQMNQDSSRSHSIFSITIERCDIVNGESHIRVGKLNLVDLAGSERQSKTQATGSRLKEAININQSLTTLGNVISSLIDPKATHVPYRDSKLTRLLQDSLGGNTKTVMVANVGPADFNFDETISTLRYAHRAKSIQNHAKINEDPKDAMIRQFQEEIAKLKQQLASSVDKDGNIVMEAEVIQVEKVITINDDEKVKLLQQKLEQEKSEVEKKYQSEVKKIEEDKKLQEKEKQQLLQQLMDKEEREQKQREQQEKLLKKLQKMQEKVIQGDEIMQKALEKERELNKAQQELQQRKDRERQIAEQIKKNEDLALEINQKYRSQAEEAQDKTKRIKALVGRLKQIEGENRELNDFYGSEIEQLQERRRDLQKELKLKNLILEYFIPEKELERLQLRAIYNEELDEWMYPFIHLAGNLIRNSEERKEQEQEMKFQEDVEEILKLEEEGHPNVFFVYTEEGPIREDDIDPEQRKKKAVAQARKQSAKKRPTSKPGQSATSKRPLSGVKNSNNSSTVTADSDNYPKAKGLQPKK
ncbi:hypothetical protein ABPG72_005701 [Tetrahymena utriculariae]